MVLKISSIIIMPLLIINSNINNKNIHPTTFAAIQAAIIQPIVPNEVTQHNILWNI